MRRRAKVISGLAVAGAGAGLATLVAFRVRHNRAEVQFNDGHSAVAEMVPSGEVRVTCACGEPNCEHVHAAAVVAAARVPRYGSVLWHTLRRSLDDLLRRPSREQAETTAGIGLHVLETEGLAVESSGSTPTAEASRPDEAEAPRPTNEAPPSEAAGAAPEVVAVR